MRVTPIYFDVMHYPESNMDYWFIPADPEHFVLLMRHAYSDKSGHECGEDYEFNLSTDQLKDLRKMIDGVLADRDKYVADMNDVMAHNVVIKGQDVDIDKS